jgi:hypothetical protein
VSEFLNDMFKTKTTAAYSVQSIMLKQSFTAIMVFLFQYILGSQFSFCQVYTGKQHMSTTFKGSLTQDFQLQVYFMDQCPLGP